MNLKQYFQLLKQNSYTSFHNQNLTLKQSFPMLIYIARQKLGYLPSPRLVLQMLMKTDLGTLFKELKETKAFSMFSSQMWLQINGRKWSTVENKQQNYGKCVCSSFELHTFWVPISQHLDAILVHPKETVWVSVLLGAWIPRSQYLDTELGQVKVKWWSNNLYIKKSKEIEDIYCKRRKEKHKDQLNWHNNLNNVKAIVSSSQSSSRTRFQEIEVADGNWLRRSCESCISQIFHKEITSIASQSITRSFSNS